MTQDAVFLIARAAEELIRSLSSAAATAAGIREAGTINYEDLVQVVHSPVGYGILKEVVPKRVKVKEIMEIAKQIKADKAKKLSIAA